VTNDRARIGLLTSNISAGYFRSVWEGAVRGALEADADLVAFVGSAFDAPAGYDAEYCAVFDVAGPECIDAAVIMADALGRYTGNRPVRELHERVGVPAVAVGATLPGVPSFAADNAQGMIELVSHLVEEHHRRRIAFIRGPNTSAEAESRYRAYRRAIEGYGLDFDESLVVRGRFDAASGTLAVRKLLDQRDVRFDALVAANDPMALGAMTVLEMRGLSVPDDVAVAGFDDIRDSLEASPPLTTVRPPSFEIGRRSVSAAAAATRGEALPPTTVLGTGLALRGSCGCAMWPEDTLQDADGLRAGRDHMVFEISRPTLEQISEEAAMRIVDAFVSEMNGGQRGSFADVLKGLIRNRSVAGARAVALRDGLDLLRRETLSATRAEALPLARDIWRSARPHDVAIRQRAKSHENAELWRLNRLREVGWELGSNYSVVGVARAAARMLPEIGISRFFLCMLETEGAKPAARLLLGCDANGRVEVDDRERVFPLRQMLPASARASDDRATFVVHPLFVKRRQMGYAVFEAGPLDGDVYEALGRHLSVALRGAQLVDEADASG